MQKLKLSEWASVAEIVASVVIIASLAYVGLELNQNTQALQQQSYQSTMGLLAGGDMTLATNEDLLRIVVVAETSPSDVSAEEWLRFTHFVYPRIATWEFLYLAKQENSLSEIQWGAFEPYFVGFSCKRGYMRFWEENQSAFAQAFRVYLDTKVFPECREQ